MTFLETASSLRTGALATAVSGIRRTLQHSADLAWLESATVASVTAAAGNCCSVCAISVAAGFAAGVAFVVSVSAGSTCLCPAVSGSLSSSLGSTSPFVAADVVADCKKKMLMTAV